jgi:ribosome biogenesis GTPase A
VGKKATKTGDEAGITKNEQRINLDKGAYLFDTPGMLWPKIIVPKSGFHLAAAGSVGHNAYDDEEVALELLETLQPDYPGLIEARYKLPAGTAALKAEALLEAIARQRGAVQAGGRVNLQKAAELVINDFRTGIIGRLTLETPAGFAAWQQAAEVVEAAHQARKQAMQRAAANGGASGRLVTTEASAAHRLERESADLPIRSGPRCCERSSVPHRSAC